MKKDLSLSALASNAPIINDYDPNAMSVEKAKTWINHFLHNIDQKESIHIKDALHRVLANPVIATMNVPNHDNSAMDGYAINTEQLDEQGPFSLRVTGKLFAGNKLEGTTKEAVRIMTGASMPSDMNAVIPQEHVEVNEDKITFQTKPPAMQNIRRVGEDIMMGQTILQKGRRIEPCDLGLLASLGVGSIEVYRRVKVAFFSTGDEIISLGTPLLSGQVYDSNRYSLIGLLKHMDLETFDLGVIPDDKKIIEDTLKKASEFADVIITTGGVSVGEADYMKQLLQKLGQVLFWKIAMKPGRPLAFGKIGNAHYFGLPGNPVAVMVTFYQFVRQAMLVLMGQPNPAPTPMLNVICTTPIRKLKGRTEFQRGILFTSEDGNWKVKTTGNQSSGVLSSMSQANCFIVLNDDVGNVEAGAKVKVQLFDGVI